MELRYKIGEFILSPNLNQLNKAGIIVTLEPKVIDLLVHFAKNPLDTFSREQIRQALWGDIKVSDHAVNRVISQLRKALGDTEQPNLYIETVAKRGYRFVAKTQVQSVDTHRFDKDEALVHKTNVALNFKSILVVIILLITALSIVLVRSEVFSAATTFASSGNIRSLTSLAGREWSPNYDPTGNWLSFLHHDSHTNKIHFIVQNKKTSQQHKLLSSNLDNNERITAYTWVSATHLLLSVIAQERCHIKLFNFDPELVQLQSTEKVLDCGNTALTSMAWSKFTQSLYWLSSQKDSFNAGNKIRLTPFEFSELSPSSKIVKPHLRALPHLNNIYRIAASAKGDKLLLLQHYQWEKSTVYLYDIAHQQTKKLLTSNDIIKQIAWAHDDKQFVFIENDTFKLADLSGSLINDGFGSENRINSVYFSPFSEELLYTSSQENSRLYQLNNVNQQKESSDKIPELRLVSWASQLDERNPTFAHDGQRLALISKRSGQWNIWVDELNGELKKLLTDDLDLSQTLIRWSPDDSKLLFHSGNSLFIYDLILDKYQKVSPEHMYADVVGWSYKYDGQVYLRSEYDGEMNIWRLDINSKKLTKITLDGGFSGNESADGRYFYYGKSKQSGLWRIDNETQQQSLILNDFTPQNHLSWYLLGEEIYYLDSNEYGTGLNYWHMTKNIHQSLWHFDDWYFGGFAISAKNKKVIFGLKKQGQWDIKAVTIK